MIWARNLWKMFRTLHILVFRTRDRKQTDTQTDRKTDRQTDRQTDAEYVDK